jgi:hypothetical protein
MTMKDTEKYPIITELWCNRDRIFSDIPTKKLVEYDKTQNQLHKTNVAIDSDYQRAYTGFYSMGKHKKDWYAFYYGLLEREKQNDTLNFETVLTKLFEYEGHVEASFSSKLVATVRPEKPVYDKYVLNNLGIRGPKWPSAVEERLAAAKKAYKEIENFFAAVLKLETIQELEAEFDRRVGFQHFTSTKKLDLLLWQLRAPKGGSGYADTTIGPDINED